MKLVDEVNNVLESTLVVLAKSPSDQESHDIIKLLKDVGIKAQTGSRQKKDILVDSGKGKDVIRVLKKAGIRATIAKGN